MQASHELGARIRAACAYAGLKPAELAKHLSVSYETYRRITLGERELKEPEELDALLKHTGLPLAFFTMDFAADASEPDDIRVELTNLRARVERLEARGQAKRLDQLAAELAELRRSEEGRLGREGPP